MMESIDVESLMEEFQRLSISESSSSNSEGDPTAPQKDEPSSAGVEKFESDSKKPHSSIPTQVGGRGGLPLEVGGFDLWNKTDIPPEKSMDVSNGLGDQLAMDRLALGQDPRHGSEAVWSVHDCREQEFWRVSFEVLLISVCIFIVNWYFIFR